MATTYESITVTIGSGSANPQTVTLPIAIDTSTGAGTVSFSYTGVNSGSDSVTATANIGGNLYSSNVASVNWQATNGAIQLGGPVTCYAWSWAASGGTDYEYIWSAGQLPLNSATAVGTGNSISFDTYTNSNDNGYGGPTADPLWYTLSPTGGNAGSQSFPPMEREFNCTIRSNLVVPAPGTYTFTLNSESDSLWGIGNSISGVSPTWPGYGTVTGEPDILQTTTVNGGFPLLTSAIGNDASFGVTVSSPVTFIAPGIYPFEIDWNYYQHTGRILHATVNGAEICPVDLQLVPTTSPTTGNLVITPSGGVTNLAIQGNTINLTINVSGIVFTYTHYAPIYEGVAGSMYITNNADGGELFTFQTYNGQAIPPTLAISDVFTLSGDNTAYQGLVEVTTNGTNYSLTYNGAAPPSMVATTDLTITAPDIAWYNATTESLDLFSVSSSGGGVFTSVELDYMILPSVVSVSPTSIVSASPGSSSSQSVKFTATLASPLSPQQQGEYGTGNSVNPPTATISGGTVTTVTENLSNGWLTGWTVVASIPTTATTATCQLSMTITGVLTYLQGTAIVSNQTMNYFSGAVGAPITIIGSSASAPVPYSFTVTPTTAGTSPIVVPSPCTLTAIVHTPTQDAVTMNFISRTNGVQATIGAAVLTSSLPGVIGGVTVYMSTFELSGVSPLAFSGTYLGYAATDSVTGQAVTWFSTSEYASSSYTPLGIPPSGNGF